MSFSIVQWHDRFQQQARWTRPLRDHLFGTMELTPSDLILEVGSGSGAVLGDLPSKTNAIGLDIDHASLIYSRRWSTPTTPLIQADGHSIPFTSKIFKISYCHFLLLWVADPRRVVAEMERVTQRGGAVIALAEPDYLSRQDHPSPLDALGKYQNDALQYQGAAIDIGKHLSDIFISAGLVNVFSGVIGQDTSINDPGQDHDLEWQVFLNDLEMLPNFHELDHLIRSAKYIWRSPERITHVPCSYAIGYVP